MELDACTEQRMLSTVFESRFRHGSWGIVVVILTVATVGSLETADCGEPARAPSGVLPSRSPETSEPGLAPPPSPLEGGLADVTDQDEAFGVNGTSSRGPVLSITLEGNKTVSDTEIRRHIKTRKGRAYDPQLVQKDLRRLFATRKFHNVRLRKEVTADGVHVTFEIVERPLIDDVQFIGNRRFSDKKLRQESGLDPGKPLNIYMVQEARRKIQEFYRSKGYVKTRVSIVEGDEQSDRRVVLRVAEGEVQRIWSVDFVGNDPNLATNARLKTLIESKPGIFKYLFHGKVDYSRIEQDRVRLVSYYRGLGYFKAEVSRIIEESDQWINLTFVIDEGPRYRIRDVSVVGNEKFDSRPLIDYLELREGDYFNLETMQHDENALRDLYGAKGHIFANIEASPRFFEKPGELDLVYQIEEGDQFCVGEINIHVAGDSPHTRRDVILNRISLHPGDIIDIREVRASERRLKASQLFVTNPTEGKPPRIVIRPPDLSKTASMAARQYRGQSPDGVSSGRATRPMAVDVFAPPLSEDQR